MSDFSFTIPDDISSLVMSEEFSSQHTGTVSAPVCTERYSVEDFVLPLTQSHLVGSTYPWADEWGFQQQSGYCCFSAIAFMLNQFVGAGVYDADFIMSQAYELNFGLDAAPSADFPHMETLLEINGVEASVASSGIVDLIERLRAGWGIMAAVTISGTDRLVVVSQVNTHNGTFTLIDPQSPESFTFEMNVDESTRLWASNDFSLLTASSVNKLLNPQDVTSVRGEMAKVALINLTGRDSIH